MSAKIICLDPGHGGWDPGAIAVHGQPEKGFTLELALAVRDQLLARYDCRVVLTREADIALAAPGDLITELRRRGGVGNRVEADLFLSLHHDSADSSDARGGSLWIWRRHLGDGPGHMPATDPATGQANHQAPRSHMAARAFLPFVRDALANHGIPWRTYGSPDGICTADFGVLHHFEGRALLLECFFGSSPADVAIARGPEFIPDLARAIAGGVAAAVGLAEKPPAPSDPAPAPAEPAAAYPAVMLLNGVRYEGYRVVDDRVTGVLKPLLDALRGVGFTVHYDPAQRTLTVLAPMSRAAAPDGGPDIAG